MSSMETCQCEVCGAAVHELRRGRCWGCYTRWALARPVGLGASCRMCGERRREFLKSIELLGGWVPMCHNCAARTASLSPLPQTLGEIRRVLERERRQGGRRSGRADGRVFPYERRGRDRRARLAQGTGTGDGDGDGVGALARGPSLPAASVPRSARPGAEPPPPVDDAMIVEIAELASDLEALAQDLPGDGFGDLTRIRNLSAGSPSGR